MSEIISFKSNQELRDSLIRWWSSLKDSHGNRAELRRCHSPTEVIFTPAYHELLLSLERKGLSVNREALVVIAGVLAHVKVNNPGKSLATQMAMSREQGGNARVSGLRFRRLLKITAREELYEPLIRIVQLLNGDVNLIDLSESIYFWGESRRKQWANDYYQQAPSEK